MENTWNPEKNQKVKAEEITEEKKDCTAGAISFLIFGNTYYLMYI